MVRAPTAPGVPHSLLPSELPETTKQSLEDSVEGKPIFEIFNAELDAPAEEMVKVLKGHLERVMKAQEEIGRMHLGLEGLDLTGNGSGEKGGREMEDGLSKREKSVDEIMERVSRPSTLSVS